LTAAIVLTTALIAGCGGGGSGDALVLYNAQNSRLMKTLVAAFTDKTGIKVEMRSGGDSELSAQLIKEGDRSPADVFTTENSPSMEAVNRAGLFKPLPESATAGVAAANVAANRGWVGVAARSTVLVYNTKNVQTSELPASMLDLSDAKWKGRFGYAPAGADFQAIVAGVYALKGKAGGDAFVQGLAKNGKKYANNIAILKAVNSGEIDTGIIYHYYWFQDRADTGQDSNNTQLHYFGNKDPGAYLSIAGAGVIASGKKNADAEAFVAFLASKEGQEVLARSKDFQYAINDGVPSNPELRPLAQLDAPTVPFDKLDGSVVLAAFRSAGIL
jgi:iron(III) transport system substrate-binding protein